MKKGSPLNNNGPHNLPTQSNMVNATLWQAKRTGTGGNHKRRGRKQGGSRAYFGHPINAVTWILNACWSVRTTARRIPTVHTTSRPLLLN